MVYLHSRATAPNNNFTKSNVANPVPILSLFNGE